MSEQTPEPDGPYATEEELDEGAAPPPETDSQDDGQDPQPDAADPEPEAEETD